jgi:alpha-glucosidase
MRVSIYDLNGNVLLEDELVSIGRKVTSGGNIVKMSKASKMGNAGLGIKTQMNLKGKGW